MHARQLTLASENERKSGERASGVLKLKEEWWSRSNNGGHGKLVVQERGGNDGRARGSLFLTLFSWWVGGAIFLEHGLFEFVDHLRMCSNDDIAIGQQTIRCFSSFFTLTYYLKSN